MIVSGRGKDIPYVDGMKNYNYRNPTAAQLERREKIADAIGFLGFALAVINIVLWCTVLK